MRRTFLFLALLALAPALAQAQNLVLAPTTVEFMASADHALNGLDGNPLVTRYEMRHFLEGASEPVQVIDLGKPTPDGENKIAVVNAAWFSAAAIVPNVRYVAKVAAIGPGGEGVSEPSNPFGRTGPPAAPTAVLMRQ